MGKESAGWESVQGTSCEGAGLIRGSIQRLAPTITPLQREMTVTFDASLTCEEMVREVGRFLGVPDRSARHLVRAAYMEGRDDGAHRGDVDGELEDDPQWKVSRTRKALLKEDHG